MGPSGVAPCAALLVATGWGSNHTLRAPLAVMRTELDVTLRGEELAPVAREELFGVRDEVDTLTRMAHNLLMLATADERRTGGSSGRRSAR